MIPAVVCGLIGYGLGWIFAELWHRYRYRIAHRWYRFAHPRCKRSGECLLDDGHEGDCDEEEYT